MAPEGWLSVAEAAERLGVGVASVRRLAASGQLEAERVGRQWLVASHATELPAPLTRAPGRPFSPRLSWALLAALDRQPPPAALHRQERARLRGYLALPRDLMAERLRGRARRHLLSVSSVRVEGLLADPRWVIGGGRAAARHLGRRTDGEALSLYVRAAAEEEFYDASYAVPDANLPNLYLRLVEDDCWPFAAAAERYVSPAVSYLDCHEDGAGVEGLAALWPLDGALLA